MLPVEKTDHYPTPVARWLHAAREACDGGDPAACHLAAMRLTETVACVLSATAVAQYSAGLIEGRAQPDSTLNRSLRSLRRVLLGQWLLWAWRGFAAWPDGPVLGLAEWYVAERDDDTSRAYSSLLALMTGRLGYAGDYGPRPSASPRLLLELVDQYRIRRAKAVPPALTPELDLEAGRAVLVGLTAIVEHGPFFSDWRLFAPHQRHLLVGPEPTVPVPPLMPPDELEASLLLYPPRLPDHDWTPLFPLDPLLVYARCPRCGRFRVAALAEVVDGDPIYTGLDPDCGHTLKAH